MDSTSSSVAQASIYLRSISKWIKKTSRSFSHSIQFATNWKTICSSYKCVLKDHSCQSTKSQKSSHPEFMISRRTGPCVRALKWSRLSTILSVQFLNMTMMNLLSRCPRSSACYESLSLYAWSVSLKAWIVHRGKFEQNCELQNGTCGSLFVKIIMLMKINICIE